MADKPYQIINPTGTAKACQSLQDYFADAINWLDTAFGEAYRGTRQDEQNSDNFFPYVAIDRDEAIEIVPDENQFGNSVFFYIEEPTEFNAISGAALLTANAVFFADLTSVRPLAEHRALSEMRQDILDAITNMTAQSVELNTDEKVVFYNNFEDVFSEYSYTEMQQIINLGRYAVLRANFQVSFNNC